MGSNKERPTRPASAAKTGKVSPGQSTSLTELLYAQSGMAPLAPGGDRLHANASHDVLLGSEELWIEDNKQYLARKRDIDREKGRKSYSLCSASEDTANSSGKLLDASYMRIPAWEVVGR